MAALREPYVASVVMISVGSHLPCPNLPLVQIQTSDLAATAADHPLAKEEALFSLSGGSALFRLFTLLFPGRQLHNVALISV